MNDDYFWQDSLNTHRPGIASWPATWKYHQYYFIYTFNSTIKHTQHITYASICSYVAFSSIVLYKTHAGVQQPLKQSMSRLFICGSTAIGKSYVTSHSRITRQAYTAFLHTFWIPLSVTLLVTPQMATLNCPLIRRTATMKWNQDMMHEIS